MLDDRPPTPDEAPPPPAAEPASPTTTPLILLGLAVAAFTLGALAVSGVLTPLLIFAGILVGYVAIQALIFKVFPPRKK